MLTPVTFKQYQVVDASNKCNPNHIPVILVEKLPRRIAKSPDDQESLDACQEWIAYVPGSDEFVKMQTADHEIDSDDQEYYRLTDYIAVTDSVEQRQRNARNAERFGKVKTGIIMPSESAYNAFEKVRERITGSKAYANVLRNGGKS